MANGSTIISNTKDLHNSMDEFTDINFSFLKYVFPYIESMDSDVLVECVEEIVAKNIKLTGYFFNADESLINIYLAYFDQFSGYNSKLDYSQFTKLRLELENIVKMVEEKSYNAINENSGLYDLCDLIMQNPDFEIVLNIVTNVGVPNVFDKNENKKIKGKNVGLRTYDQDDIIIKINAVENEEQGLNLIKKFGKGINAVLISSNKDVDVYLTSFCGKWLADLYKEDSIGLLSANVRSYLKRTNPVNREIIETVKYAPQEFVAYNNGLSAIATDISVKKINDNFFIIEELKNFLIVNGGQTTATLFECQNDRLDLSRVLVPAKLAVIKNERASEDLINNISTYSNRQTAIKKSDPPSNSKYYKRFEALSKEIWATKNLQEFHCFFERTNGQYNTLKRMHTKKTDPFLVINPEKAKFTKLQLAQAIVSWQQRPDLVCTGQEKNFSFFNNTIKDISSSVDENYFKASYALILIYRKLDTMIKKKKLQYKSNVIAYTIALLSNKSCKYLDLMTIWNNQEIPKSLEILLDEMIDDVYEKLLDSPENQTDIRMWARKAECWNNILSISKTYNYDFGEEQYDFFPTSEERMYIDKDENFKNAKMWKILYQWNEKHNVFNEKQKSMIYQIPALIYKGKMKKKDIEFAKNTFIFAVEEGFDYKKVV